MNLQLVVLSSADHRQIIEIDDYSYLRYRKRWQDLDDFELRFSGDCSQGRQMLADGVLPSRNKFILHVLIDGVSDFAGLIDRCERVVSKSQDLWTISGYGLDRYLSDRPLLPPTGLDHDNQTGPGETVMKALVNRNLVAPLTSGVDGLTDSHRAIGDLVIETDTFLGSTYTFDGRFQTLDEALREIARGAGDLGFSIVLVGEEKRFRVSAGQDRSATAVFALELDNVEEFHYTEDGLNFATHVIVAGQGEGAERTIIYRGGEERGSERRELFVDARDVDNSDALERRAESVLVERSIARSFSATLLPGVRPFYLEDYEVGDLVTVRNDALGINEVIRIQEIELEAVGGREPRITPSLGREKQINLKDKVRAVADSSASSRT